MLLLRSPGPAWALRLALPEDGRREEEKEKRGAPDEKELQGKEKRKVVRDTLTTKIMHFL